jgi:hypothetical protein
VGREDALATTMLGKISTGTDDFGSFHIGAGYPEEEANAPSAGEQVRAGLGPCSLDVDAAIPDTDSHDTIIFYCGHYRERQCGSH